MALKASPRRCHSQLSVDALVGTVGKQPMQPRFLDRFARNVINDNPKVLLFGVKNRSPVMDSNSGITVRAMLPLPAPY
jgi:hypothetical protein